MSLRAVPDKHQQPERTTSVTCRPLGSHQRVFDWLDQTLRQT
jgi:hypothetical protein